MVIELDHCIMPAHGCDASARRQAELFGLPCGPAALGPFFTILAPFFNHGVSCAILRRFA